MLFLLNFVTKWNSIALNRVWHVDVEVNKDIADIVIRNNQNERYVLELVAHARTESSVVPVIHVYHNLAWMHAALSFSETETTSVNLVKKAHV